MIPSAFITSRLKDWWRCCVTHVHCDVMKTCKPDEAQMWMKQLLTCSLEADVQAELLTSSRHDFMLPVLLFVVLLLVALLSLTVGPLLQLRLLVDGAGEGVLLGVHVQRVLIV